MFIVFSHKLVAGSNNILLAPLYSIARVHEVDWHLGKVERSS